MRPIRLLYTLLTFAALPFIVIYLARKQKLSRQCFGDIPDLPQDNTPAVWLHAVSIGESVAADSLIKKLRQHQYRIVLTHTTVAGGWWLRQHYGEYAHIYQFPIDLPFAVNRFLKRARPQLVIMMEAEYWANTAAACRNIGARLILANGKLSKKSARRHAYFPALLRDMAGCYDATIAQTRADAKRLKFFGFDNVIVAGNLKFDRQATPEKINQGKQWREKWQTDKTILLIAGSRPNEEALLLPAINDNLWRRFFIIIVPRHIERGDEIAALLKQKELSFNRRAKDEQPNPQNQHVYLADTLGEMDAWYACADIALIGGSFMPYGGQNPIEAMAAGVAAIIGPHHENYLALCDSAQKNGALICAADATTALSHAVALANNKAMRARQAQAARDICEQHKGSLQIHEDIIMHKLANLSG